jgi:colanic acid/amylovoran biosynthesis glycosyltransferase
LPLVARTGLLNLRPARSARRPRSEVRQLARITYLVSRFPHVSETFIAHEISAVSAQPELDVELRSLFPPRDRTVHPVARPWLARLRRPSLVEAAAGVVWWLRRRPLRLASSVGLIVAAHARRPRRLARALATFPIAAAHAREIAANEVDHVHAHYASYPLLAAWICARLVGAPYSFTAHAHDLFIDQSFLRRGMADARFAVAISEFNRRFLARYGCRTPVHVVHCGIDVSRYRFRPRAPAAAGRPTRLLCVASLQEYKGHRVLLDALAAGPELSGVEVDLVGDGPLRRQLQRLAARLGLAGRIRFHGSLPEPDVAALLERADLFVLPSVVAGDGQMEGIPVALMEALAAGVPVVASRLSGIPELIREGETGLLVSPDSPRDLRRAMARLLAEPGAKSQDRARAGRRLVEREFELRRSAETLARLFRGCPGPQG